MRRRLIFALLSVVVLIAGCRRVGPVAEGNLQDKKAQDRAVADGKKNPTGTGEAPAAETELRGETADDSAPPAQNPMIGGLEKLLDSAISDQVPERDQLRGQLREADELLSRARTTNQKAIREANRQQRVAGEDMPNLVLLVVRELRRADLGCYGQSPSQTPNIDRLAAEGVRFAAYRAPNPDDGASTWSLLTGLAPTRAQTEKPVVLRPDDFTVAEVLWQAGYTTAMIGDCSLGGLLAGSPDLHGFDEWFGFRNPDEARSSHPEQLWSNGARLRVPANAAGKKGHLAQELLLQEIQTCVERHGRGRPFFLCLAWPLTISPKDGAGNPGNADIGRLDRDLGAIADVLRKRRTRTVLMLAGFSDAAVERFDASKPAAKERQSGAGAKSAGEGSEAPLIVWAPGRFPGGAQADIVCSTTDVLPTMAELAGARRRPRVRDGTSLVPTLQRQQK